MGDASPKIYGGGWLYYIDKTAECVLLRNETCMHFQFFLRKISVLHPCDMFALQYDIIFNAQKSKFLVICATCWRSLYASMCKRVFFFIGGNQIENVDPFSHLGDIIDSRFTDDRDIYYSNIIHLQRKHITFCAFLGN